MDNAKQFYLYVRMQTWLKKDVLLDVGNFELKQNNIFDQLLQFNPFHIFCST